MPQKNMEAHKRKSTLSNPKMDSKRAKTSHRGHFRVMDLKAELPFSTEQCLGWFNEYASSCDGGRSERVIGPEGVDRLCRDLEVNPEDIVVLALAWKLKAAQMGFFTRNEWLHGMIELQCDNLEKLKRQLDNLRQLLHSEAIFKSIYQYSFDFSKNSDQRTLEIEMAKAMLQLLLESRWPCLPAFIKFIDGSKYKVLNRDQWNNILEFSRTIKNDLTNYDVNGAWPVMLDEFVEKQKLSMAGSIADI